MYQCAQSAIQPNNLNLPVYDIHQKQARDQILVNFHTLANTAATISERHMQKCKQQNDRIQLLRQRIGKCKDRIQSLGCLNQAIVFVSPSQYPTKYEFNMQANRSRFNDFLHRTQVSKLDMNAQYSVKHEIKELGKQAKLKLKDLDEFILFLFGKLKGRRKTVFEKGISNKHQIDNLGRIPSTIRYLDSLTVFNTNINPYKKYEIKDVLVKIDAKANKKKQDLQLQNNAIINDNNLSNYKKQQFEEENIRFIPGQKKWQQPEWQDNLGLGNVVDFNSAFNDDTSFINQPKKKTVAKDHMANKKQESNNNSSKTQSPNRNTMNNQSSNSTMMSRSYSEQEPSSKVPQLRNAPVSLLPPPPIGLLPPPPPSIGLPPPPSIGLPPPPSIGLPPPLSLSSSLPPGAGSGRSALLNDIQNPNLIKRLKKTVTKQYTGVTGLKKKGNQSDSQGQHKGSNQGGSNTAPPPMDMMSALKAKINQRFRALHPQHQDSD